MQKNRYKSMTSFSLNKWNYTFFYNRYGEAKGLISRLIEKQMKGMHM